jgi:UDPglucose--hexose-1-phosphate uridylyltransferase
MQMVVASWHRRFEAVLAQPGIEAALLFRNFGDAAGASLRHSHSQLVALPIVPPGLATSLAWALQHHDMDQVCATCKELACELESGLRVIEVAEEFAVLVPFAAGSPLEQWIVPRTHEQSFMWSREAEREGLAELLRRAVARLKLIGGDCAYNIVIEPGSIDSAYLSAAHWSVRIIPHLTTPGGFEMLTSLTVNPSSPEEDARRLRASPIESN